MPEASETELTFAVIARVASTGVVSFQAYEDAVLPLLSEFGGKLQRRLRNADGTIEVHIVSFPSEIAVQRYRSDGRRRALAQLLEHSAASVELIPVTDVAG